MHTPLTSPRITRTLRWSDRLLCSRIPPAPETEWTLLLRTCLLRLRLPCPDILRLLDYSVTRASFQMYIRIIARKWSRTSKRNLSRDKPSSCHLAASLWMIITLVLRALTLRPTLITKIQRLITTTAELLSLQMEVRTLKKRNITESLPNCRILFLPPS